MSHGICVASNKYSREFDIKVVSASCRVGHGIIGVAADFGFDPVLAHVEGATDTTHINVSRALKPGRQDPD